MIDICGLTWIDPSPNCILNITAQLILVWVSQYFVSKISPAFNLKINESPKTNLFWLPSPNHNVGFWVTVSWVLFPKILSLYFTVKFWHGICNPEICLYIFIIFGKRIERLHGAYWNTKLASYFYYTYYSFITKFKKDKHLHIQF